MRTNAVFHGYMVRFLRVLVAVVCLCASGQAVWAQDSAVLTGWVSDPAGAAIPGAKVTIQGKLRALDRTVQTNDEGYFLFENLAADDYRLEVSSNGLATLTIAQLVVRSRDRQDLKLVLQIAANRNSVTVEGQSEGVSGDSSINALLEQDFLKHLPLNGRRIDNLLQMAPGVTSTGGGIHVNGLRNNTNYYMLDGVSLSSGGGVGPGGFGGGAGGGGGPMGGGGGPMGMGLMGAGGGGGAAGSGGGSSVLSLDSLEEVRIQTSAFAPEFGRTPGAQVSMNSRGGSNQIHGSAYEYFRNHHLNANDWFANQNGYSRGRMLQNQFGATLGGPIVKNRTFFFASVERLQLQAPVTSVSSVPDTAARNGAAARLRPFLRAFPIANGAKLSGGAAQFVAVTTQPLDRDSASLRVDHTISSKHALFARYNFSPSSSETRGNGFTTANSITRQESRSHIGTAALISQLSPYSTNDLRANYSVTNSRARGWMDNFGGAIPLTDDLVFPTGVTSGTGQFNLMVIGLSGYNYSLRTQNEQRQFNIVDTLTMNANNHQYKMGVDVRRIRTATFNLPYGLSSTFNGLSGNADSLLSQKATVSTVTSNVASVHPQSYNFSYFLQDTWRVDADTTITVGMRWDVNPAPGVSEGQRPFALSTEDATRITTRSPLYDTRWFNIAPRFGLSHVIRNSAPGRDLVLRGGIGIFNDLGYGTSLAAFSGVPYTNSRTLSLADFPLANADKTAPVLPAIKPYNRIGAANRDLESPRVVQWSVSLEKALGTGQSLSVGYAGTRGTKLLRTEQQVSFSDDYDLLTLATNGAESDYHALQVQFRRRFARNLQVQLGYTWAHSIDTASTDAGFGSGFATLFTSERGNSDYDVRHTLNVSGSYLLPSPKAKQVHWLTGNWFADFLYAARTGLPFDITGVSAQTSDQSTSTSPSQRGLFAQVRPDYNGQAVWIPDSTAPGGIRLNRSAFAAPSSGFGQGNLGRNSIGGYGMSQLDLTIRRQIRLTERFQLHVSMQGFNVLNQPNFANPQRNEGASLASSNFGVSTRSLNQGLFGGIGSVYQTGGPRSLQAAIRLQF